MEQHIDVSLDNIPRWGMAFKLLSMERFFPFLAEMCLPEKLVASPKFVAYSARKLHEIMHGQLTTQSKDPHIYATQVKHQLEDAFEKLARDYDEKSAMELYFWCVRYIVDDNFTTALEAWRQLLNELCGVSYKNEHLFTEPLHSATKEELCNTIRHYLRIHSDLRERINSVKNLPLSEWEKRLEDDVRTASGLSQIMGAIDMVAELVESIIAKCRTYDALEILKNEISNTDRDNLLIWATRRAAALKIQSSTLGTFV
jgi:hypothetical protein